jgi:hypothetical protein
MMRARWVACARSRYATSVLAVALGAVVIAVAALLPRLQSAEAHLAAWLLAFLVYADAKVPPGSDTVYLTLTDGQRIGIEVSAPVAAALLALPLLIATVAVVWLRPDDARAALLALLAGTGTLVLENQLRIVLAAMVTDGVPRYQDDVVLTLFGSMVTVVCLATAILLYVFVFIRTRQRALVAIAGESE